MSHCTKLHSHMLGSAAWGSSLNSRTTGGRRSEKHDDRAKQRKQVRIRGPVTPVRSSWLRTTIMSTLSHILLFPSRFKATSIVARKIIKQTPVLFSPRTLSLISCMYGADATSDTHLIRFASTHQLSTRIWSIGHRRTTTGILPLV